MKSFLTTVFTTITVLCIGQVATLDIKNPSPRISDGVNITVSFEKKKIRKVKGAMSSDEFNAELENQLGYADISFRTELLDTGLVKIGPFNFTINEINFKTETITIKVYPDLPDVFDGIWLRLVAFKNVEILILEQRISHNWKTDGGHSSSWSIDAEGVEFADVDSDKAYSFGIKLDKLSSSTSSGSVKDEKLGYGIVSYKVTQYKMTKTKNFKSKTIITRDWFRTFPTDIQLADVEIR